MPAFCSGRTSAQNSSSPSFCATACGSATVIAGEHHDADSVRLEDRESPRASEALIGSATPSSPAALPSIATKITVCPARRSSSARALKLRG